MVNRGFGLEIERKYADINVVPEDFDLDWWNQADDVDFKLNDDLVTKSGSSRMNKRARAGYMKPTGSTSADADLQQLAWYFLGYLDNYVCTAGQNSTHIHEYWGGEGKHLTSFRGLAVYDNLKKYLYGLIIDQLKLEVSDEGMKVGAEWLYSTEEARIIGQNGETFEQPDELTNEEIFIMPYDISLTLGSNIVDGISNSLTFDGNNNHDVDKTLGFGSRRPQRRANAQKRENQLSINTTLTDDTIRTILDVEYGVEGALKPSDCKILKKPFRIDINHCENPHISGEIYFPECTLRVEYNYSGADIVEATISLESLGAGVATLVDHTQVTTDMYVKLVNNQPELVATQ